MSFSQLPINVFDVVVIAMLGLGIYKGRKYGMSEELLRLLKWLAIVFGCAFIYEPAGRMLGQYTTLLGRLSCYLLAYVGGAVLIVLLFAGIQRLLGGKLVGSDVFGRAEYYLGMGSGMVRLGCILLAALALLNARYFSPTEVRAMEQFQDEVYGSDFFPTLHTVQASVFDKSLTGPWIKRNLSFLFIKPTEPENKPFRQREAFIP